MVALPLDLTPDERELIKSVQDGTVWNPAGGRPTPGQLADVRFILEMPVIRAKIIRAIICGCEEIKNPDPRGLQIVGVRINEDLDLAFVESKIPISIQASYFTKTLIIRQATLPSLNLSGSRFLEGLSGDGVTIAGNLFCEDGFSATGEVRLLGAKIGGQVSFENTTLNNPEGKALFADGIEITGDLVCRDGFLATGEVQLLGAKIGGQVLFEKATLNNPKGKALFADGVEIAGDLFCRDGFSATGEVRLLGAKIGGMVIFANAKLNNPKGNALFAERVEIADSLFCRDGFSATGKVNLVAVKIDRLIDWRPTIWNGQLDLSHCIAGQWRDSWNGTGWENLNKNQSNPKIKLENFSYAGFLNDCLSKDAKSRIAWIQ